MNGASFSVSTRLTPEQAGAVENLAQQQGVSVAELIRGLVLRELGMAGGLAEGPPQPNRMLAEIVGIRLLLVNLLRPACVDSVAPFEEAEWSRMLDEIKRVKHEVAMEIQLEGEKK